MEQYIELILGSTMGLFVLSIITLTVKTFGQKKLNDLFVSLQNGSDLKEIAVNKLTEKVDLVSKGLRVVELAQDKFNELVTETEDRLNQITENLEVTEFIIKQQEETKVLINSVFEEFKEIHTQLIDVKDLQNIVVMQGQVITSISEELAKLNARLGVK